MQTNIDTQSSSNDKRRVWLWTFLLVLVLSQLYFVRELVAAFALFAIGFAAIASIVVTTYMLQKACELALARLAALRQPIVGMASVSNMASVGNMASVSRESQKAA